MAFNFNKVQPVEPKPAEKKLEPVDELKAFINTFLDDGKYDEAEAEQILQKAAELNISEDEAIDMMETALNQLKSQPVSASASSVDSIYPDDLLDVIKEGEIRNIKSVFRTWQNAISSIKTDNDQYDLIQCLYYMTFAALNPDGIIAEQESRKAKLVSNYWRIYWTYIAYMKNGRDAFAEDLLAKLQTFSDYDEDNISILETIAELNQSGAQAALKFYNSRKADDRYSNELQILAKALKVELGLIKPTVSNLQECSFVTDNLIWWEDEEARTERKARQELERQRMEREIKERIRQEQEAEKKRIEEEQEKLRNQVTYTIKILSVDNQLNAMFALKKSLNWDAAELRENLAMLPFKVLETDMISKAKELYEQLNGKGLKLQISAVNALGELVKPIFLDASKDNEKTERNQSVKGTPNVECEFIDLGLSVLWANCNLGADSPEKPGNHYAWGETEPKQKFSKKNYTANYFKERLDASHDPATTLLGSEVRVPTKKECEELIEKCKIIPSTLNGFQGYKVIGVNGNSIFLPTAGVYVQGSFARNKTAYWTSTSLLSGIDTVLDVIPYCVSEFHGTPLAVERTTVKEYEGISIRPVKNK